MKKTLLLSFFLFFGLVAIGQSDRSIAFNAPTQVKPINKSQIKVFPNPFTSYIKIDDKDNDVKYLVIYNLLGKKMKTFVAVTTGESYSVADLPRGFYLVQMQGERNKVIKTQRLQKR